MFLIYSNVYTRRTKDKVTLVSLQDIGVVLQEEWQKIPRAAIRRVVHMLLHVEVTPDTDLDSVSFMRFKYNKIKCLKMKYKGFLFILFCVYIRFLLL